MFTVDFKGEHTPAEDKLIEQEIIKREGSGNHGHTYMGGQAERYDKGQALYAVLVFKDNLFGSVVIISLTLEGGKVTHSHYSFFMEEELGFIYRVATEDSEAMELFRKRNHEELWGKQEAAKLGVA